MPRYRYFTSRPAARICPYTQKSAPKCPRGHFKTGRFQRQERDFWRLGMFYKPMGIYPTIAFLGGPKSRAARPPAPKNRRFAQKTFKKSPGGIELTTTRRPQQITKGSETMGLTVLLKEVTQRKSGALAAQPKFTTFYCGAQLR